MKYLSIITNFGCHYNCPYCVVKNNSLKIPKTTISGLDNLQKSIDDNGIDIISISGGGDPLYNIDSSMEWYDELFGIIGDMKLEIHTTYKYPKDSCGTKDKLFYSKFYRSVYHILDISDIEHIRKAGSEIVRVVFVVDSSFTEEKIDQIVKAVNDNPDVTELSFRQMLDVDFKTTNYCEEYLDRGHKKDWFYIKGKDYNLYYSENNISYKYTDFKK